MRLHLYQTLQDRNNPTEIERDGPFPCRNKTAWLGIGYYFWDSHIELGHWWGDVIYNGYNYVICKAKAFMDEYCWDLHGNGEHRIEFENVCYEMINEEIASKDDLLVYQVIEFLRKSNTFKYKSIRALTVDCMKRTYFDTNVVYRVKFKRDHISYLDLKPPIQICLLEKDALNLQNYGIVYPSEYLEMYA